MAESKKYKDEMAADSVCFVKYNDERVEGKLVEYKPALLILIDDDGNKIIVREKDIAAIELYGYKGNK